MEINTTTTVPAGPPTVDTKNHTYTQHHLHSENQNHHHGHFPSKTILITIAAVTLVTVLFTIFLVVFLLRRQKSSSKNGTCKDNSRAVLRDTSSRLIASTSLNFNSSPDVKGGCLHGGNSSRSSVPKFRGVQVFTYRELEVATDGFSEANLQETQQEGKSSGRGGSKYSDTAEPSFTMKAMARPQDVCSSRWKCINHTPGLST